MSSITANPARETFLALHAEFNAHGMSERAELLCSELAARVATEELHTVCVGVFEPKALRKVYGLVYVLSEFSVTLRSKMRPDGSYMVYAEIEQPTPVQFVGSFVKAKRAVVRAAA